MIITTTATTNVRPDTSQLITIGLSNGSGSEDGRKRSYIQDGFLNAWDFIFCCSYVIQVVEKQENTKYLFKVPMLLIFNLSLYYYQCHL